MCVGVLLLLLAACLWPAGVHLVTLSELELHPEHVPFYLASHPGLAERCRADTHCPLRPFLDQQLCWGYEDECPIYKSFLVPECDGESRGWAASKRQQLQTYYEQADFGYVRKRGSSMFPLCLPLDTTENASSMNCSSKLEFCRGQNLRLDFRDLASRRDSLRYKMDILKPGQMSGFCRVDRERLESELEFMSALQSWSPEVQHLTESDPLTGDQCDLTVTTPTYIMKIDAPVSMYHHFCDFFNLYASQHLNDSLGPDHPGSFSRDKQILIWENIPYRSAFQDMFQVFTDRPIWDLNHVAGKRVCFKDLVLPLPPRMIFGLFYNTPLIPGCAGSGLFRSFSQHVLHRLRVPGRSQQSHERVRLLWLSRQTRHRRVLNEQQLLTALQQLPNLEVVTAAFTHRTPFMEQVRLVASCDVLAGMHGAGLTHLLFLPDWAVVYELYHCEDTECYRDLARLRGLQYITTEDTSRVHPQNEGEHPELGAHEKFTNYTLEVTEVVGQVRRAADLVRGHASFQRARRAHSSLAEGPREEL